MWDKRDAKLRKMFKIKKFIMPIKTYAKYEFKLSLHILHNFSTFYVLTFSPISLNGVLSFTTSLPGLLNYMSANRRFKLSY